MRYETYMRDEDLLEKITSMSLEEAKNLGIPRRTFYRLKGKLKTGNKIKIRSKTKAEIVSWN